MRLLVVEDEKSMAKALKAILEKNNYSVDTVFDGAEALDYIQSGHYDAVILDIMLPKVDGITVLSQIRDKGILTPVLMLTAKSEIDDKCLGLDTGANDYLTKPFASKELLARLRAITRSCPVFADNCLHIGNVTLDRSTYELSSPKGRFRLANKEFQMMEMLMRNPKSLISTEHFLSAVWGYDTNTEIKVVWVYISYLRKKLELLDAKVQIKAARNAGYCLEEL